MAYLYMGGETRFIFQEEAAYLDTSEDTDCLCKGLYVTLGHNCCLACQERLVERGLYYRFDTHNGDGIKAGE